jgi:hypothetical protein
VPQHCSRRASLSSLLVFTLLRDVVLLAAWFPLSAEHLQMLATASAVLEWRGGAGTGCGAICVASAEPAERAYSFMAPLASGNCTNPQELLAAAHASCFAQSLALVLQAAGTLLPSSTPRPLSHWSRTARVFG